MLRGAALDARSALSRRLRLKRAAWHTSRESRHKSLVATQVASAAQDATSVPRHECVGAAQVSCSSFTTRSRIKARKSAQGDTTSSQVAQVSSCVFNAKHSNDARHGDAPRYLRDARHARATCAVRMSHDAAAMPCDAHATHDAAARPAQHGDPRRTHAPRLGGVARRPSGAPFIHSLGHPSILSRAGVPRRTTAPQAGGSAPQTETVGYSRIQWTCCKMARYRDTAGYQGYGEIQAGALPWSVFLGCPACISRASHISHRILGIPYIPVSILYPSTLQQICCIPLHPTASSCIRTYI